MLKNIESLEVIKKFDLLEVLLHQQKDSVGTAQAREQAHLYQQKQYYNFFNHAFATQQAPD